VPQSFRQQFDLGTITENS